MSSAAIVGLLFSGCPAAIAGLVVPVVVDPFNGEVGRRFSHVGKEVVKNEPAFADGDAPGSVPLELRTLWVCATLDHMSPAVVGSRDRAGSRSCMPMACFANDLRSMASATEGVSSSQVVTDGDAFGSAIATINPACICCLGVGKSQNGETSKSLTAEIYHV